jgi:hypothetical protein
MGRVLDLIMPARKFIAVTGELIQFGNNKLGVHQCVQQRLRRRDEQ